MFTQILQQCYEVSADIL